MAEYKVGDRVRRTEVGASGCFPAGTIGVVDDANDASAFVRWENGETNWYSHHSKAIERRLEPAPPYELCGVRHSSGMLCRRERGHGREHDSNPGTHDGIAWPREAEPHTSAAYEQVVDRAAAICERALANVEAERDALKAELADMTKARDEIFAAYSKLADHPVWGPLRSAPSFSKPADVIGTLQAELKEERARCRKLERALEKAGRR